MLLLVLYFFFCLVGKIHFFQGRKYWVYDDDLLRADPTPGLIADVLECASEVTEVSTPIPNPHQNSNKSTKFSFITQLYLLLPLTILLHVSFVR